MNNDYKKILKLELFINGYWYTLEVLFKYL